MAAALIPNYLRPLIYLTKGATAGRVRCSDGLGGSPPGTRRLPLLFGTSLFFHSGSPMFGLEPERSLAVRPQDRDEDVATSEIMMAPVKARHLH